MNEIIWNKNLEWLKKNTPQLLLKVIDHYNNNKMNVQILGDDSNWNVRVFPEEGGEYWLHSNFDREKEYEQIASSIATEHASVVMLGCPSGAFIGWLRKKRENIKHLVIVEPNISVFCAFLQSWSIEKTFFSYPKVSLVVGVEKEEVGDWIKKILFFGAVDEKIMTIVSLVNYRWHYGEYESILHKSLIDMLRFSKVNRNTLSSFRDLWLVNFWHNLQFGDASLGDFENCFRGIPAVIVSAGPSLDKNIHLLREIQDKALIVAVGSAISVLCEKEISCHFRVALDPDPLNEKVFANAYYDDIPLIYSNHLYFRAVKKYQGKLVQVTLSTNSELETHLLKKAGVPTTVVESGFSVANITANILATWKCNPIVFVGQDLAYTENRMHAKGAWDNEFEEKYIKKMYLRKDIFGNDVYTDAAFDGMRQIFERTIFHNPETRFLNATEGGMAIGGAENYRLSALKEKWVKNVDCNVLIRKVFEKLEDDGTCTIRKEKIKSEVVNFKGKVELFSEKIRKNIQYVERLLKEVRISDKDARRIVRQIRKFEEEEIYQLLKGSFKEMFSFRREGYLKSVDEQIVPQVQLFYLELNDILDYLCKMLQLIQWYLDEDDFKIIFDGRDDEGANE